MKSQHVSGFLVAVLTIIIAGAAFTVWKHERLVYPTPESESAFIKNYSPENAIKPFQADGSSGFGHHYGGGAGHDYVTRTGGFDVTFVSHADLFAPLQQALIDDASKQLRTYGAIVKIQGRDPEGNYCFLYTLGKSLGSIKIFPVTAAPPGTVQRVTPLKAGLLDTRARIEQKELWFPQPPSFDPITLLASNSN